jgi:hypothetical protein
MYSFLFGLFLGLVGVLLVIKNNKAKSKDVINKLGDK